MPPDRDIEFIIELIPGTGSIAQRPYRMNPVELVELKKQLDDRDFYFCALRSLVVLSFPQPLNFSSVFPSL
jgi:hypothetical protein